MKHTELPLVKTDSAYAYCFNVQINRNGVFYDVLNEKFFPPHTDTIMLRDYSREYRGKNVVKPYTPIVVPKKKLVWLAFRGIIPENHIIDFVNNDVIGNRKYSLDNLYTRERFKLSPEVIKKRKERKDKVVNKIITLAPTYNKKEVCKIMKISEPQLRKLLTERNINITLLFNRIQVIEYIIKNFLLGKNIHYIATKKKLTSSTVWKLIGEHYNFEPLKLKKFHRRFKPTIQLLINEKISITRIDEIFREEFNKWMK